MELVDLLQGLQARAPWLAAGRPILLGAGFVIHRGYEKTIDGALAEKSDPKREARLEELLKEHAVAGEKLITLVKISKADRSKIEAWINGKRKSTGVLTDAFPGVASKADIIASRHLPPASLGSLQLAEGIAALFTASRSYASRVELPASKLKPGAAADYEKIYAIQRTYVQTYDAIWLPSTGSYVCIATDLPQGAPTGFASLSQTALLAQLRGALGKPVSTENLWPAIEGLYDAREGRLIDYGFVNNSDAVKHHTGRRGGKSLWDDIYDKAGAEAVGEDLLLFKIAIAWARPGVESTKAQPEVLLPGTAMMLHQAPSRLDHAIVRSCLTTRDLHFVVSKIAAHF